MQPFHFGIATQLKQFQANAPEEMQKISPLFYPVASHSDTI
jgi:hypothetical protein